MSDAPSTAPRFTVRAVSACGTYREALRCVTREEAERYKAALEAEGWRVRIIEARTGGAR